MAIGDVETDEGKIRVMERDCQRLRIVSGRSSAHSMMRPRQLDHIEAMKEAASAGFANRWS